jgi:membrane protease YdiL (CAAX protease family)
MSFTTSSNSTKIKLPFKSKSLSLIGFGFLAFLITVVTGGVWSLLVFTNLMTSPQIPWAVAVMALFLWWMWQYLAGRGQPYRTSAARHTYLRANSVSGPVFGWALLAGMLGVGAMVEGWIVLFQLVKMPGNFLPDYTKYPLYTIIITLLMASLVTSVAEEASFRGYFLLRLQRQFAVPAAIVIATLVIAPAHGLTQGFMWPTLLFYFLVDLMFGVMAYLTNSILPGILVHTIGLFIFFTLVWPNDATRPLISERGADGWYWGQLGLTLILITFSLLAFRRLTKITSNRNV